MYFTFKGKSSENIGIKIIDFFEFYDYNYEYKKEKKLFEASFFPLLPVIM